MNTPASDFSPRPLDLTPVERGILWPVVYASVFGAPVRASNLWARLVGVAATESEMRAALAGPTLRRLLTAADGLVSLRGSEVLSAFNQRARATRTLLERHREALAFVVGLKHARFVGLSGACAHETADDGDIDVFVVTAPGALWRTLLQATLVAKLRGWRRVLCLNYLVDATALALPRRDFYGAFELVSLKPLSDEEAFDELLSANNWAEPIFPNFFRSRLHGQNPSKKSSATPPGRVLEAAARMIQRPYLRLRLPASPGVELSNHVVRLHTTDHRTRLLSLSLDAFARVGMEAPPWI